MRILSKKVQIALALLVLLFSACKKDELPPDDVGPTAFGIIGNINNNPVSIEAGIDNYYMYTSYNYDASDSVYTFTGELKKTDCSSCTNTLTISIRNSDKGNNAVDIANLIKVGQLTYRRNTNTISVPSDSLRIFFDAEADGIAPFKYSWDFGPYGTYETDTVGITVNSSQINLVPLCLTVFDDKSSFNTTCDTLNIDPDTNCTADFDVTYASSDDDTMSFLPTSSGNTHAWDFGDGNSANTSGFGFVPHKYIGADSNSTYTVRLTSTDGLGCKQTITKRVRFEETPVIPSANYNYQFINFPPTTIVDSADLSQVTITWVDNNGTVYTSRNDDQPSTSTFEILEAEPYSNNENGEKTFKFTARVNCRLYNGTGFIELKNAMIKFAVAYP